jgi:hypothetical protein
VALTTDPTNVYHGNQALQFTLPQQTAELSDGVDKDVSPEQGLLFLRFYTKFMPPYDVVGSSHNGGGIPRTTSGPTTRRPRASQRTGPTSFW